MHMWLKELEPLSWRYKVIVLTSHFGFRDLVTLKLGQGHRISNLRLKNEDHQSKLYEVISLTLTYDTL